MPIGASDYTAAPRLSRPASMSRRLANPILGLLLCCGGVLVNVGVVSGQALTEAPPFETPALIEPAAERGEESVLTEGEEASAAETQPEQPGETPAAADELRAKLRVAHPWARFGVGAWCQSQTVSEAFDASGAFAGRSLTERTERLVAVDDDSYTIAVETVVSLAGLRRPESVETLRHHLLTDRPYELGEPAVSRGEATSVSLGGMALPCRQWIIRYEQDDRGQENLLYLADESTPLVLRKERQAVVEGEPSTRSEQSVTRIQTPILLAQAIAPAWHTTTRVTQPDGSRSESFSVHSPDVPGGLYSQTTTEFDSAGNRLRWAVTTVMLAGTNPADSSELGPSVAQPAVSIEVRPRRLLRLLRREERRIPDQ